MRPILWWGIVWGLPGWGWGESASRASKSELGASVDAISEIYKILSGMISKKKFERSKKFRINPVRTRQFLWRSLEKSGPKMVFFGEKRYFGGVGFGFGS